MRPPFFTVARERGWLHLWAGPIGLHLRRWGVRPDWCGNWKETP